MKIVYSILAALLTIAGMIVSILFFKQLANDYSSTGGHILLTESGQTGDFIGGIVGTIFSLAGFFILIVTLSSQNKSNYLQRFETNFFELLKIHRDNVADLKKQVYTLESSNNPTYEGRKVIQLIVRDILTCREEVKIFFRRKSLYDIYERDYANKLRNTLKFSNPKVELIKLAKINIPYCIVFFGVDAEGRRVLERLFEGKYKPTFYKPILDFVSLKPSEDHLYNSLWQEVRNISDYRKRMKIAFAIRQRRGSTYNPNDYTLDEQQMIERLWYKNDFVKFYGGNQYRLGHYFRHLYQTVTFVDNERHLKREKKYFYIKTLRGQLSTHEQVLVFLNSLSFLGIVWELTPKYNFSKIDSVNRKRAKNKMLLTKYQLIKNIPSKDIFGFKVHDYYPNIKLETEESYFKSTI